MSKKTNTPRKAGTSKSSVDVDGNNTEDQDHIFLIEGDQQDDWSDLFTDDSEGNVVVQLQRTHPDITIRDPETGADCRTVGYCEDLPPGLPSYLDYIRRTYGGGQYRVQRRVNGVVRNQKYVRIQGRPLFGLNKTPATPPPSTSDQPHVLPDEKVDNVSIGGSDGDFEKRMERLMIIKRFLDGPSTDTTDKHLTETLLTHLLTQKNPDPVSQIQTLGNVLGVVKGLMPEPSTGASWEDILNTLIKTFGDRLAKRSVSPGLLSTPVSAAGRPLLGKTVGKTVGKDGVEQTDMGESDMLEKADIRQLAGLAIQNIVISFRLDPPKEPDRVVKMLDLSLNLDAGDRAKLQSFYDPLFDLAETQLEADFAEQPDQRSKFKDYFKKVFGEYTRSDRKESTL